MTSALIGHTGFVGGNLTVQHAFDDCFNSSNITEMAGREYDLVVCAGVKAVKWMANKHPEEDRAAIESLAQTLGSVRAKQFVLISTIDVYPVLDGADESFDCHAQPNHAYGANRLWLEDFCSEKFDDCRVIRLPGLFGDGLKKNVIFDMLNDNMLEVINPDCSFQYYCLDHIWRDIQMVLDSDQTLVNFFGEPVATSSIVERFFPGAAIGSEAGATIHYNLVTQHAGLRGNSGDHLYTADEIMADMDGFISRARGAEA